MKRAYALATVFGVVLGIAIGLMLYPLVRRESPPQVTGWLQVVHFVCTSIGGLGTFVALIIVLRQFFLLRTQSDLVQKNIVASVHAQLYGRLDSFNRFGFEHYQEYDLLDRSYLQEQSPEERSKLHRMCDLGFTFFEEIYKYHTRLQLLEKEDWDEWQQNLLHFLGKPYVRGYWRTVSARYAKSFQALANGIVDKIESEPESDAGAK
jgi:hypothetical protein